MFNLPCVIYHVLSGMRYLYHVLCPIYDMSVRYCLLCVVSELFYVQVCDIHYIFFLGCSEFKRPLCIEYIDYEKAFDSIEHEAIFKALRSIGINEIYITILEDIYTGATARVHVDNQVLEEIQRKKPYFTLKARPTLIRAKSARASLSCEVTYVWMTSCFLTL